MTSKLKARRKKRKLTAATMWQCDNSKQYQRRKLKKISKKKLKAISEEKKSNGWRTEKLKEKKPLYLFHSDSPYPVCEKADTSEALLYLCGLQCPWRLYLRENMRNILRENISEKKRREMREIHHPHSREININAKMKKMKCRKLGVSMKKANDIRKSIYLKKKWRSEGAKLSQPSKASPGKKPEESHRKEENRRNRKAEEMKKAQEKYIWNSNPRERKKACHQPRRRKLWLILIKLAEKGKENSKKAQERSRRKYGEIAHTDCAWLKAKRSWLAEAN